MALRSLARDDLVVFALTDAAQRVILPQRVTPESVPSQNAPQVGMPDEDDAEHVIDFPLHPLRAGPHGTDALELQPRIALLDRLFIPDILSGSGLALGIEEDLEPKAD